MDPNMGDDKLSPVQLVIVLLLFANLAGALALGRPYLERILTVGRNARETALSLPAAVMEASEKLKDQNEKVGIRVTETVRQAAIDFDALMDNGAYWLTDNFLSLREGFDELGDELSYLSDKGFFDSSIAVDDIANSQTANVLNSSVEAIIDFLQSIMNWFVNALKIIFFNWKDFFLGEDKDAASLRRAKEDLKAEIREEILREMGVSNQSKEKIGVAVYPKNDTASSSTYTGAIANSFSDEVIIRPDNTGRAGVITPVFRSGFGEDYMYVLVPIKESN